MWENILNGDSAYSIRLKLNKIGNAGLTVYPGTLDKNSWSAGPPYIQEVAAPHIEEGDYPTVFWMQPEDEQEKEEQWAVWTSISQGVAGNGKITFVCNKDKPNKTLLVGIRRI